METATQDSVEELRAKMVLKEKEAKAIKEMSQYTKRKHEHRIAALRSETKELHRELEASVEPDEQLITTAFGNMKEKKLSMKKHKMQDAIHLMDHKVSEVVKRTDILRYQKAERERKLEMLMEIMRTLIDGSDNPRSYEDDMQIIRQLENALAKALIKQNTARIVGKKYEFIIDKLNEEKQLFPRNLQKLEGSLAAQKDEKSNMTKLCDEACRAKDDKWEVLKNAETGLRKAKKRREISLQKLRNKVEKQSEESKELITRKRRPVIEENTKVKQNNDNEQSDGENSLKQMNNLKDVIQVTNANDAVTRFISHKEKFDFLERRWQEVTKVRNNCLQEKAQLDNDLQTLRYIGDKEESEYLEKVDEMKRKLQDVEQQRQRCVDKLDWVRPALNGVRAGVHSLLNKMMEVEPNDETNMELMKKSVLETPESALELCEKKLQRLLAIVKDMKVKNDITSDGFQEYMKRVRENVRVTIQTEEEEESDELYTGTEVLTRAAMKESGKNLLANFLQAAKNKGK